MTRFVTKLAAGTAAFALAVTPGVAAAQTSSGVDEKTGPVAFANAAALKVGNAGEDGGTVISETQRSPLKPGVSKLSQDRTAVPKDEGEKKALGPYYLLSLGKFGPEVDNPFPEGVASRDHNVSAQLKDTTVPTAVAEANYALRDFRRGGNSARDNTVFAFQGAKSFVDCAGNDKATGSTTADKLWVRGKDGKTLEQVEVPVGDKKFEAKDLPAGPSIDVDAKADLAKTKTDLTISRVTAFDQLLKQAAWRSGDTTVAAGWQVELVTHVKDAKGDKLQDVKTTIVLGGVSCSLPKGFTPANPGGAAGGGQQVQQPNVPVKIPAGVTAPPEVIEDAGSSPLGYALLGGGVLLAAGAIAVTRRRRPTGTPSSGE
ncbi:hypothetical protein [Amycolatopsis anabasis]|uniref:hypothetical protein n=1 Tax=Amycolatopsis anabasis TaxID=1840409 RepID=UPI00131ED187|nr:hypothetical protein [Amycolatopsis anabasis]